MKKVLFFLVLILSVASVFGVERGVDTSIIIVSALAGMLAFGKINVCFVFGGHKHSVGGLSIVFWVIYVVLIVLTVTLVGLSYAIRQDDMITGNNVVVFGVSMLSGLVFALVYWFLVARDIYHNVSEYETRMKMRTAGWPRPLIEAEIRMLREKGVLTK
jgi:hypothetical protein